MLFRERKQIVICVAAAAMVGGFVLFRYLPLRKRIEIVRQAKSEELLTVSKGRTQTEQLPVLEEQLRKLAESIGDYEARIPREREIGAFLGRMAELMNEHNLKEQVIAPGGQIRAEDLICIPVEMQCRGKLGELFEFFKRLQTLDRLIRIEQVKLTNDPDFSGQVTMETRVIIYYTAQAEQG